MKIAVVVLSYNSREYIARCLDSLQDLDRGKEKVEVWVVDNASTDGSAEYLRDKYPGYKLVVNQENQGYAEGNNVGIRHARAWGADWIWIVNPDIKLGKKSLTALLQFVKNRPQSGIVGSKVYYEPGFETHPERYEKSQLGQILWYAGGEMDWDNVYSVHRGLDEVDSGKYDRLERTEFVTGASMLLRSKMLQQVGLLDPKYFLYYEENDLCQRALRAGWQLWYVSKSQVWHANAQATGMGSPLVDYYTTRNRMLFGMRWAPIKSKLSLVKESVRLLISGRPWQKRGELDFYLGRFGKGSYA